MRRALVILLFAVALRVRAAEFEAGIAHFHMTAMGERTFAGGELEVISSRGFAATAEVFWTPRISTQFAASFVNPAVILRPASPPPDDVDLGTLGIDTYSLSARWHFAPEKRFSAYAGAGVALVTFGNLEDRFGDDVELRFDNETAFLGEAGVRYRFRPSVFFTFGATYMPAEAAAGFVRNDAGLALPDKVQLDPLIVRVGAAWRF